MSDLGDFSRESDSRMQKSRALLAPINTNQKNAPEYQTQTQPQSAAVRRPPVEPNSSTKSSFSKKSAANSCKHSNALNGNLGESETFQSAMSSFKRKRIGEKTLSMESYIGKIRDDFDMYKMYEDSALKILNEMPLSRVRHPENADSFAKTFKKTSSHKRTIFLDLDDTITYVSLFKTDSQEQKLIQIVESEGTSMKVRISKPNFCDRCTCTTGRACLTSCRRSVKSLRSCYLTMPQKLSLNLLYIK